MLEEDRNITVKDVLKTLFRRRDWQRTINYPIVFNSLPCINYDMNKCDLYTSLYRMLVGKYEHWGVIVMCCRLFFVFLHSFVIS